MATPFTKNESIVVLATRRGEVVRKPATVRTVQKDGKILVKFDDGTEKLVSADKCQHKRGRKAGSTVAPKTTEKPAARTPRNSDNKPARGPGRPRKIDAAPATEKKVNNLPKGKTHLNIMGAVTKSMSDGRMGDFMENPGEETAQAIADVVFANLMALTKGGRTGKRATSKATAAPKAKRNSRKIVAEDDEEEEVEAKPAKRAPKKTAKNAAKKTPAKKSEKPTVRVKAGSSRRPMADDSAYA